MSLHRTLGVFARAPEPGRVKTRLAASLGDDAAARLHAAFVTDTLQRTAGIDACRVVAFTPDAPWARGWFQSLECGEYELWPQPGGDLGIRLSRFFAEKGDSEPEAAVVIGADSPTLPLERIEQAFERLNQHDCVVAPATDGGYVLIGLRLDANPTPRWRPVFKGIDWGGPQVLDQTVERLQAAGLSHTLLPPWYDVDTIEDLRALRDHLAAMQAQGQCVTCPATLEALRTITLD
jgi:rSAM/selenodomain-associated transferase 1